MDYMSMAQHVNSPSPGGRELEGGGLTNVSTLTLPSPVKVEEYGYGCKSPVKGEGYGYGSPVEGEGYGYGSFVKGEGCGYGSFVKGEGCGYGCQSTVKGEGMVSRCDAMR